MEAYLPGRLIFQCLIFLPFHAVHGVPNARILTWFASPFSSGPHFVRPRLAGPRLPRVAAGHTRRPAVRCWSPWACEPSPGAGYQSGSHPGAWAGVLLALLADADGYWRMPRSRQLPGLSVATGRREANPLPRSREAQRAPGLTVAAGHTARIRYFRGLTLCSQNSRRIWDKELQFKFGNNIFRPSLNKGLEKEG